MADIEKVKQGLRNCDWRKTHCDGCAYRYKELCSDNITDCTADLASDALSVIEEQQAEIERLTKTEEQKQAERKQKRRAWQAKYRESHRQQAYQTTKEWRKNNPEKWKEQQKRYRERQKQLGR